MVTQIIRGQPVSTAISAPSTVSSTPAQKGLTSGAPTASLQSSTSQPPRPQQGQVKLTMAQLTQLTQGHVSNVTSILTLQVILLTLAVSFKTCTYLWMFKNVLTGFPDRTVVKNPPASAGHTGLSPGSGRSHMPRSSWARAPQLLSLSSRAHEPRLLSPHATTTEACAPRARAPQQEKPQQ